MPIYAFGVAGAAPVDHHLASVLYGLAASGLEGLARAFILRWATFPNAEALVNELARWDRATFKPPR
jgi:hypothetical protein